MSVIASVSAASRMTWENRLSWGILLALFFYMYAVSSLMPLHRDDFEYSLIWGTNEKVAAMADVFQSLYNHYLDHGGRMVAYFVLVTFLMLGKAWFDPFNALLFVALVVLIYWHSQRQLTMRFNPYVLLLISVFCWLSLPHFGEVVIWKSGACTYLLTMVLVLAFLLPYHWHFLQKPLIGNSVLSLVGMLAAGIIAGWTLENLSATTNLIVFCFLIWGYRQKRLQAWMVAGFVGTVTGLVMLVAAPGNYVRYTGVKKNVIFHFTNQLAAGGEILLYLLPVVLFLIMGWRLLVVRQAGQLGWQAPSHSPAGKGNRGAIARITAIIFLTVSYLYGSFFSYWLATGMYQNIAVPLGVATPKLHNQFFNTMSGLEEMLIYLLLIIQIYAYSFTKLGVRKSDIRGVAPKVKSKEMLTVYPNLRYTGVFLLLALINHFVMIAAPTFPGRAGFGSVVFVILAAASLFTIPAIREALLTDLRKRYLAVFAAIVFVPMAAAVLYQHAVLHSENSVRMAYIETVARQGATYVELEPVSLKNRVLRHVYFVELNNSVSKGGLCRYYGLQDLIVK